MEATHAWAKGWHLHVHALLCFSADVDEVTAQRIAMAMWRRWDAALRRRVDLELDHGVLLALAGLMGRCLSWPCTIARDPLVRDSAAFSAATLLRFRRRRRDRAAVDPATGDPVGEPLTGQGR